MKNILDIFYNHIIEEASKGNVDSLFLYNVVFSTKIENDDITKCDNEISKDLLVPTLEIKDKNLFDSLLINYVESALKFYNNNNFDPDLDISYDENKMISREKTIIALMFSNFSYDDFKDPITYLKRRIEFFENDYTGNYDLGYSDICNGNLKINIEKEKLVNEAPYKLTLFLNNSDEVYEFPKVNFGISDNKIYIYSIQGKKDIDKESKLYKKINRLLYKVGEGFSNEEAEIYGLGNLKDITSSFLISAISTMSFFSDRIDEVVIPSILVTRYNAKKIANDKLSKNKNIDIQELEEKQQGIQENLTEKFLRTFLRLNYHFSGIGVKSYPFEYDTNLHLKIDKTKLMSNNRLLNEMSFLSQNAKKDSFIK